MWSDFKTFLIKQNALALAIAVVIGAALGQVVDAIVKGFIAPLIAAATGTVGGNWQAWKWAVGPFTFDVGLLLTALLNFFIVGFVAWRLTKLFIREAPAASKAATKSCPECLMEIDARATRCPHCTSQLTAVKAPASALSPSSEKGPVRS